MNLFSDLFDLIAADPRRHSCTDPLWRVMAEAAKSVSAREFGTGAEKVPFGPFGELTMPYYEMGAITSVELFGIDELIIFAFYNANRTRYRRAVDFGANIGLHTILLSKSGFDVRSFEPDERHARLLERNVELNGARTELHQAAISVEDGEAEFVRVLGNTTGSHLKGAKKDPYGDLDVFKVKMEAAGPHLAWADFAKIDIEGHEAELLTSLPLDTWATTDAILEVGTPENAERVYRYFEGGPINLFAQKIGWRRAESLDDIPTSHREGSVFISSKDAMPW